MVEDDLNAAGRPGIERIKNDVGIDAATTKTQQSKINIENIHNNKIKMIARSELKAAIRINTGAETYSEVNMDCCAMRLNSNSNNICTKNG